MPARAGDAVREGSGGRPAGPDTLAAKRGGLDSTVVYTARDSLIYNFDKRTADLFGKAKADYKAMHLTGPRITVDHVSKTMHSSAASDSTGKPSELPVFTDQSGSFTAEVMTYNYQTRKGDTTGFSSQDEEGFYRGRKVRRMPGGELYIKDGVYTTCDLEEPHYWFEGSDMKIVPGDRLVSRPFVMYIHPEIFHRRLPKIPILALPFMSVPISNKRASGFLVPGLGSGGKRGTYFSDFGYFWAIDDYTDLRLEGDYALNGSWRAGQRFRYKYRGQVEGTVESEFETVLVNHPDDPAYEEFSNRNIRILHHQQFDPTSKLDLNLQYLGGDREFDVSSINLENIITQQATSYASFLKSWDSGNRVLSIGYQRVDGLDTDNLTQTVSGSIYQSQIYPFRSDLQGLDDDWRSRLWLQPSVSFSGTFSDVSQVRTDFYTGNAGVEFGYLHDFAPGYRATVTQGVNIQRLDQQKTGVPDLSGTRVELPFKVQSTLFRYLNLTPSVTFTNYRVNRTRAYDADGSAFRTVDEPDSYSTMVFQLDAQTRLYGVLNTGFLENLVGLKAIRHTFIPTVSFIANPDYRGTGYDYYGSYPSGRYNRFEDSLYPGVLEERRYVGVTLQNLFHGKFRNPGAVADTDGDGQSADRTVQLLSLTATGGYNFAAETFPISPLNITLSSNAIAPAFQMTAGANYDFYAFDYATGQRVNQLNSKAGGGLLRFLNGYLNMSVDVSGTLRSHYDVERDREGAPYVSKVQQAIFRDRLTNGEVVQFSPLLPWSLRASLYLYSDKTDPRTPTSSALLNTSARVSLSRNWQAGVNTSYDLKTKEFIYPTLVLYRDLHDFQFSFQYVPSGEYRSYMIEIAMKPPQLRDLRISAGSSYR